MLCIVRNTRSDDQAVPETWRVIKKAASSREDSCNNTSNTKPNNSNYQIKTQIFRFMIRFFRFWPTVEHANRTNRFLSNPVQKCRFEIYTFKVMIADYVKIKTQTCCSCSHIEYEKTLDRPLSADNTEKVDAAAI